MTNLDASSEGQWRAVGLAIGQQFDGAIIPFLMGFTLCGASALLIALWANRFNVAQIIQ